MFRIIVILLCLLVSIPGAMAQETAVVTLPLLAVTEGQDVDIVAEINCPASTCGAFDITIQFDAEVLQVNRLTPGAFLGEDVFVARNSIDQEAGILRMAATALGELPETDDTALLIFDVTALKTGASQLVVSNVEIGGVTGDPMAVTSNDGGLVVSPSSETTGDVLDVATCDYRVGTGDTLFGIALANGVTVDEILDLNDIPNRTIIRVGDILTIPSEECAQSAPVIAGGSDNSTVIEVYDCRHMGGNLFEWYTGQRQFDSDGNMTSESRLDGPFSGAWQPGCPAGEQPASSSGSGSSSGGSNSSSGGGDDEGGGTICIGPLCL